MTKHLLSVVALAALMVLSSCNKPTSVASNSASASAAASASVAPSASASVSASASASVSTSKAVPVESVTLDKTTATLKEGETVTLVATVLPANATNNTGVIWTTSDATIATVADGVVTAVKAGTATITASAGGKSGTCAVTVETKISKLTDVTSTDSYTVQGVVDGITTKGFVISDGVTGLYVYMNAAPTVANGDFVQVTGVGSKYNGFYQLGTSKAAPTVTKLTTTAPTAPTAIALTSAIATGWLATGVSFTGADIVKYSWTATALLDSTGKYFTLNIDGSNTPIEPAYPTSDFKFVEHKIYKLEGYLIGATTKYASIAITKSEVQEFAPTTITISAENNATKIVKGATVQLTAAVTAAGAYEKVTWASSDDTDDAIAAADKVTVDATGLVTAPATAGEHDVTITATSAFTGSTVNATYKLTVVGKSVVIDGLNLLSINEKSKLTYSTTDDSTTATFTAVSSDTTLATIAADGTVTPLKAGEVTITVSSEGYSEATFAITIVSNIAGVHGLTGGSVTTKGVVKGVVSGKGYMLADNFNTDGTANYIYVYDTAATVVEGDYVEVTGTITTDHGYEIVGTPANTIKLTTTAPTITDTAKSWTNTEYEAWDGSTCALVTIPYVHIATSGAYINLTIPGSSYKGSLLTTSTITDGLYSMTAYAAYLSGSYRYFILAGTPTAATSPAATKIAISAVGNATTVRQGDTLQLSASQTPFGAEDALTWTSSDTNDTTIVAANKVTVSNGLVTVPSTAAVDHQVTITAASSATLKGTYTLTITKAIAYTKLASYDFSTNTATSSTTFTDATLLAHFTSYADTTTTGLSNIVTAISGTNKAYSFNNTSSENLGIKLGTSSIDGTFTAAVSSAVSKVVISTVSWTASDTLTVGDAASQTPGLVFNSTDNTKNTPKELSFVITAATSIKFTYHYRGLISKIVFYAVAA